MGYSFIGKHRKTDDESVFYEECAYAYALGFKRCFGKWIHEFSGRVTKKTIEAFKFGLDNFKATKDNNRDDSFSPFDLSSITYDKLCDRLSELLQLMEDKKVCYLIIG